MNKIQPWVNSILANPITKLPCSVEDFKNIDGVIDARVFLKNTYGYSDWTEGQEFYEREFGYNDLKTDDSYLEEIEYDRPIYQQFKMAGRILDCGGGPGTVREFLDENVEFISTDPWLYSARVNSDARKKSYTCLNRPLNFIGATAEFQPFLAESFDWVHMRSMLDHVQVADLAILEALRILRPGGKLLIGLYVDGGKSGVISLERRFKDFIKNILILVGIDRWKDHHIWHPTYKNLLKLVLDNGFIISETYWQPKYKNMVCYVCCQKPV